MNRKEGSGQPRSVTTEESINLIEGLICSEETPSTWKLETGISRLSIRRLIKRRNFRQFKRVKTPEINDGCRNRRYTGTIALAEKFERNTHMIKKTVWQDEKDFTPNIPINLQSNRVYGKGKNLMFQMRTCLCPRIRCQ